MAEVSKSISYEVPNKVTGKTEVVIYSTTGEPRTQKEFDAAKQAYKAGEEASMKDFAFLPPGSFKEVVRRGFEAVNQPVQKGLRAVGGAVGEDLAPTGFAALAQKLGIVGPGAEQRLSLKLDDQQDRQQVRLLGVRSLRLRMPWLLLALLGR